MSADIALGLVRIGVIELAVPADAIEEIVRGPIEISAFPHAPRHVLGAFALRGQPMPTVDLAELVRPAAAAPGRPVNFVLVLRHAQSRFAVQIDELRGVVRASGSEITELETRAEKGLFSRVYTPAKGGRVSALLDLEAVLNHEGVRVAPAAIESDKSTAQKLEAFGAPLVVVKINGTCLALDASSVKSVTDRPEALDTVIDNSVVEGFRNVDGQHWPVVKLGQLLHLSQSGVMSAKRFHVFITGKVSAALVIDEIVGLDGKPPFELHAATVETGADANNYLGSYVHARYGVVLVVNLAGLLKGFPTQATGALRSSANMTVKSVDSIEKTAAAAIRYIVYRSGGAMFASALDEIESVVELTAGGGVEQCEVQDSERILSHNGEPVLLVNLAEKLRLKTVSSAPSTVLCIRTSTGMRGLLIDRVESLHSAVPEPLPGHDRRSPTDPLRPIRQTIFVRDGENRRTACVLSPQEFLSAV